MICIAWKVVIKTVADADERQNLYADGADRRGLCQSLKTGYMKKLN